MFWGDVSTEKKISIKTIIFGFEAIVQHQHMSSSNLGIPRYALGYITLGIAKQPFMHPDISEFSYGYALTESLVSSATTRLRAAPVFPSLIEEGRKGGGYDVKIPFPGTPLFLQFKLSHRMVRDSAIEVQKGVFHTPFFRMHLRPTKHSQQHPMLLELEATGAAVFYAAPYFHTPAELNDAYTKREVVQRSVFIKPSEVGTLPDKDDHHVAFKRGHPIHLCSENPRVIRESMDNKMFMTELNSAFADRGRLENNEESARSWADRLESVVKNHRWYYNWITDEKLEALQDRNPITRFAYLARTFFGCNVILVARATEGAGSSDA